MRRTVIAAVAALVGLIALVGAALSLTSGGSTEVGGNILVNREGLIDVSNSPTVAYNPARKGNVVVTYRKDRPGYDALISYSFDGGESWEQSVLPLPQGITGCTASQGAPCPFAPDIAFAPDGTLYVTYVNLVGNGNRPDNLWISTSTDGGRTLALPTKIAGPLTFQQRVTVDPKGPVYVTWVQAAEVGFLRFADPPPRIVTARSDDGAKTFGAPVPVSDSVPPARAGAQPGARPRRPARRDVPGHEGQPARLRVPGGPGRRAARRPRPHPFHRRRQDVRPGGRVRDRHAADPALPAVPAGDPAAGHRPGRHVLRGVGRRARR